MLPVAAALALLAAVPTAPRSPVAGPLRALVWSGRREETHGPRWLDVRGPLRTFYAARGWAPAWTEDGVPTDQARAVAAAIAGAADQGLDPADLDGFDALATSIRLGGGVATAADLARFDVTLTASAMRYAATLRSGRVDPRSLGHALDTGEQALDLVAVAAELATAADPVARLAALEPRLPAYGRLLAALARYRALAPVLAALPPVPVPRRAPRPGETWAGAGALAERLLVLGDLGLGDLEPARAGVYTEALAAGVARFQARHALAPDGLFGPATVRALAVGPGARIRQLELALERWRWMPDDFELPALVINVAEARLLALEARDGRAQLAFSMEVIVGDEFPVRQTPVFARRLDHVVFRPYWEVPLPLLFRELVPRWKADPSYFVDRHFFAEAPEGRLPVDGRTLARVAAAGARVRQEPGPWNALGAAKFMFPNEFMVYLHGTNHPGLFARADRTLSNGCVRIPDPARLAEFLLAGQPGWDADRIASALEGEDQTYVRLDRRPWVFIVYGTAHADREGAVHFFRDVYGHDARLDEALRRSRPRAAYQARTRPSSRWTKSDPG